MLRYSCLLSPYLSGAKLCMLSDLLGDSGSLTGVDVARHRLAACRTMLQKYALGDRCRLFVADGTSFSLLPLRAHIDESAKVCLQFDPKCYVQSTKLLCFLSLVASCNFHLHFIALCRISQVCQQA